MYRSQLAVLTAVLFVAACEGAPTQTATSVTPQFASSNAATQIRLPISGTITNDCTGEVITFAGEEHGVQKQTTDGTVTTTHLHVNTSDIHGVSDTGAKYVIMANAKETLDVDFAPPFPQSGVVHEKVKLTSQGSGDNESLLLDQTFTFDGTTYTSTFTQVMTCHG